MQSIQWVRSVERTVLEPIVIQVFESFGDDGDTPIDIDSKTANLHAPIHAALQGARDIGLSEASFPIRHFVGFTATGTAPGRLQTD